MTWDANGGGEEGALDTAYNGGVVIATDIILADDLPQQTIRKLAVKLQCSRKPCQLTFIMNCDAVVCFVWER